MVWKISFCDFQEYFVGCLIMVVLGCGVLFWLGIEVGDEVWFVDFLDGGEIVQVLCLVLVLLIWLWFVGIVNICGNLYVVIDFLVFCGGVLMFWNINVCLLLVGVKYGVNVVLLVLCMLGLKNLDDFMLEVLDVLVFVWGVQCFVDM